MSARRKVGAILMVLSLLSSAWKDAQPTSLWQFMGIASLGAGLVLVLEDVFFPEESKP